MSEELKACPNPWCEALERDGDYRPQVQYSNFGLCYVACSSCTMHGPTCQHEFEAIAAWNTRADPALAAAQAEVAALQIENARLRAFVADIHNSINIVGSPYDQAMKALDDVVSDVRKRARAALVQP